jgi:hypothetical protein
VARGLGKALARSSDLKPTSAHLASFVESAMAEDKPKSVVSEAAAAMGRVGGPARAKKLTAKRRKEIAEKAAAARWAKKKTGR